MLHQLECALPHYSRALGKHPENIKQHHCCPVNFFPSFRRRPESSGFNDILDSGLRRNDKGVLSIFMSLVPQNNLIAKYFAR